MSVSSLAFCLLSTVAPQDFGNPAGEGIGGGGTDPKRPKPAVLVEYGMNASVNGWAERVVPFADGMARALEFEVVRAGKLTGESVPLIPLGQRPRLLGEGWPDFSQMPAGEQVAARVFSKMAGTVPDGMTEPYVLTWDGEGSCKLKGQMVVREGNRTSNRVEVLVDPEEGGGNGMIFWELESSNPDNPVRNAHIWLPGMEAKKPILWPPYVEKVRSVNNGNGPHSWRALNWNRIREYGAAGNSGSFTFDLAGRITPSSPSQGTLRGVCPEYQVALCNAIGMSLHFNVPHQTDQMTDADYEKFLRRQFRAIRDGSPAVPGTNGNRPYAGLAPGLEVTIELSNEIWNPQFLVRDWVAERSVNNGVSFEEQVAWEVERVFDIADEIFHGAHQKRLRKYIGARLFDPSFLANILANLRPDTHVDAVGPAIYFKPPRAAIGAWMREADPLEGLCPNCPTPEQVVVAGITSMASLRPFLATHTMLAQGHFNPDGSSPLMELYEAGQSFVAGNDPWGPAATVAQTIPDMFDAYVNDFVPMLIDEGVDVIHWYSFMTDNAVQGGSNGPFGHWDNMDQEITLPVTLPYKNEGAPKAAAICLGPPEITRR